MILLWFPWRGKPPAWTGFTFPLFWEVEQRHQGLNEGNNWVQRWGLRQAGKGEWGRSLLRLPANLFWGWAELSGLCSCHLPPFASPGFVTESSKRQHSQVCVFLSKSVGCTEVLSYTCQNHKGFFRQEVSYNILLCLRKLVSSSGKQS